MRLWRRHSRSSVGTVKYWRLGRHGWIISTTPKSRNTPCAMSARSPTTNLPWRLPFAPWAGVRDGSSFDFKINYGGHMASHGWKVEGCRPEQLLSNSHLCSHPQPLQPLINLFQSPCWSQQYVVADTHCESLRCNMTMIHTGTACRGRPRFEMRKIRAEVLLMISTFDPSMDMPWTPQWSCPPKQRTNKRQEMTSELSVESLVWGLSALAVRQSSECAISSSQD
jgi:hypothetical protein